MKNLFLFISLIALASCAKDTAPDPECDIQVSFSQEVMPLLQDKCVACHNGSQPPNLTTHGSVSVSADDVLSRISLAEGDGSLMPQGGPRLADSLIQKVKCWINQGKLDN